MQAAQIRETPDREAVERLARCVSTMVFYESDGWSWAGAKLLVEEARSLSDWASASGQSERLDALILRPMRAELADRFGPVEGQKLHREFLRALRDLGDR